MTADDKKPSPALAYTLVCLAAALWATWPFFTRGARSLGPISSPMQAVVAVATISLTALPFALRDRVRVRPTRGEWASLAILGVGAGSNIALLFAAYEKTSVAIAVLTHYLTPLFVALAAPLAGERTTARTFVAAGVSFAGLVMLLEPWKAASHPGDVAGALCGAGSAVFYASNVLLQKRIVRAFSGSEILAYQAVFALPVLLLFVPREAWATTSLPAAAVIFVGGVVPGMIAGRLFINGLRGVPASHASTLTLLEPLLAVLGAAVVYGETLGLPAFAGAAAILGGAALVVTGSKPA